MNALLHLLPHLVNGLSLGLLFALIALGFMLIVGVMETINLAHGSLFALGMYVALFVAAPQPRLVSRSAGRVPGAADRHALCRRAVPGAAARRRSSACCSSCACAAPTARDPLYGLLLTFGAALVIEELIRADLGLEREAAAAAARRSRAPS